MNCGDKPMETQDGKKTIDFSDLPARRKHIMNRCYTTVKIDKTLKSYTVGQSSVKPWKKLSRLS
jgi:hypothetical protein